MGRLGGKAKAASHSTQERSRSARHAVQCRWARRKVAARQSVPVATESLPAVPQDRADASDDTDLLSEIWFPSIKPEG